MLIDNVLCAFYAPQSPVDEAELVSYVKKHLPYYSVPERWTLIEALPLTNNGKVDRKALRAMVQDEPRTELATTMPKDATTVITLETQSMMTPSMDSLKSGEKKGTATIISTSEQSIVSANQSSEKLPEALPPKNSYHGLRWLQYRALILYRRFLSVVALVNIGVAVFLLKRRIGDNKDILPDLAIATATNLVVAVMMRWELVVNLLFTVFCSVPVSNGRLNCLVGWLLTVYLNM